ncbi:MAG: hypothetical protein KDD40_03640, partial [Bdellovibrionales bacterium]|nr:hypothetical protein [Bdellovibrionales bacterium]
MNKMLFSSDHFGYFSLSDPAGIVFFQKVFELAHQCLEDYTRNSPITWHNWFAHAEWGVPLVHSESHFLSPLVSGQMITIELYLEK